MSTSGTQLSRESSSILEVIGRDAFLTALNDSALRIRVLDQRPLTLDDALNAVCRMETYGSQSVATVVLDRRKIRFVKAEVKQASDAGYFVF